MISDIHLGRPKVFMNGYDKILFPTQNGVAGEKLEERLENTIKRINQDESLDFAIVLGDYSEGAPQKALEILKGIKIRHYIMSGNHDPLIADPRIVSESFIQSGCYFLMLETQADERTRGYFSKMPLNEMNYLRQELHWASNNCMNRAVIFTHCPIFTRMLGPKPKNIVIKAQNGLPVTNIAGHYHKPSYKVWNNGKIEQIVLSALFCDPRIYKFSIDDNGQISYTFM